MEAMRESGLQGLGEPKVGKVREMYDLGETMLMVATDRISAFDVVLPSAIPGKGRILTQMSAWWFGKLADVCPNHMVSKDPAEIAEATNGNDLGGRGMIVRKAEPLKIECVVRGYITGSLFADYQEQGARLYELDLPEGLEDGQQLPEPIFTPATKAASGHDQNLSLSTAQVITGTEVYEQARKLSLELYRHGADHAKDQGFILADTKFEFGLVEDELILIDEVLTPDSSRYWLAEEYEVGKPLPQYDKQIVRDWLKQQDWDRTPPGPELPPEVIEGTRKRYEEVSARITGA